MAQWQDLHTKGSSWRKTLVGEISDFYTIPKYQSLFKQYFAQARDLEVLELGAGNGDLTKKLVQNNPQVIKRYVVTEQYEEALTCFESLGLETRLVNAEAIALPDNSFDLICAFDVMHHVFNPRRMAEEMTRVSRKYIFLTEANGLSLGRKAFEKRQLYQQAQERSYLPSRYKSFFDQSKFKRFTIEPFLFVFKTPNFLLDVVAGLSEVMERLPILRWQCATLAIFAEKY